MDLIPVAHIVHGAKSRAGEKVADTSSPMLAVFADMVDSGEAELQDAATRDSSACDEDTATNGCPGSLHHHDGVVSLSALHADGPGDEESLASAGEHASRLRIPQGAATERSGMNGHAEHRLAINGIAVEIARDINDKQVPAPVPRLALDQSPGQPFTLLGSGPPNVASPDKASRNAESAGAPRIRIDPLFDLSGSTQSVFGNATAPSSISAERVREVRHWEIAVAAHDTLAVRRQVRGAAAGLSPALPEVGPVAPQAIHAATPARTGAPAAVPSADAQVGAAINQAGNAHVIGAAPTAQTAVATPVAAAGYTSDAASGGPELSGHPAYRDQAGMKVERKAAHTAFVPSARAWSLGDNLTQGISEQGRESNLPIAADNAEGDVVTPVVLAGDTGIGNPGINRGTAGSSMPTLPPGSSQRIVESLSQFPDRPVEVTLSPEELGRVRMSLATHDGALTMLVQADRPETLELLRRHIDTLAQDLRDLGFEDLTFAFGDQKNPQQSYPDEVSLSAEAVADNAVRGSSHTAELSRPHHMMDGGLDLRL